MRPLNGKKTHPLSTKAKEALAEICCNPVPRQQINPGLVNRLLRGKLVREIHLKSPYAAHKGGLCVFLEITAAGKRTVDHQRYNKPMSTHHAATACSPTPAAGDTP